MKKLLALLITLLTLTSLVNVRVFSDTYVPSIAVRQDVVLTSDPIIEHKDSCKDIVVLNTYMQKDEIESEYSKQQLEIAYKTIIEAENVVDLNGDIESIAHNLGVETEDLVVRDLFDITEYTYFVADGHNINEHVHDLSLELETQTLENFVCLLVYYDDEWHVIDDVTVLLDQNRLDFITDELSPFAIVVATQYKYVGHAVGCIWHLFIVITMLITFILTQIIRNKDDDTDDKKKKYVLIRDIICLVSLILSIIFYIFGTCEYDIFALIASVIINIIVLLYSHPYHKKDER